MQFHLLPYNLLLKDNADDIRESLEGYQIADVVEDIIGKAEAITSTFGRPDYNFYPQKYTLDELPGLIDFAFIALHGRPGEDGTLQQGLIGKGIPFNGSGPESSSLTINKYTTNEVLREAGLLIPEHLLIEKPDWKQNQQALLREVREKIGYPLIAKPADDGCSSAVKKIDREEDLIRFAEGLMRDNLDLDEDFRQYFKLKYNEEIPCKTFFVVEELVKPNGAARFIEITGGLLTRYNEQGELEFAMFEPSEAMAEGGILSLEEKFLAGEGQNITPARFSRTAEDNAKISAQVKSQLQKAALALGIEGYCRIDAFVRIFGPEKVEVVFIEANSLPGLTPATCIFHQAAIEGYKPAEFLEQIINFGTARHERQRKIQA